MRTVVLVVFGLCSLASFASAGPNAGGVIVAHNPDFIVDTDYSTYCGLGTPPPDCQGTNTRIDTAGGVDRLWTVYAIFDPASSPRLKGVSFGVHYTPGIAVVGYGPCIGDLNNGAAEFPGAGWPRTDTGTAVVFQYTQTTVVTEVYWFFGYDYYGTPETFAMRDNPDPNLGGMFGDDSVPPLLDPIAGYGVLGFNTDGSAPCGPPDQGACCICDVCTITDQATCESQGGSWMQGIPCDPNPCPNPPLGACCFEDGHCESLPECDCHTGNWLNQPCDPNPCGGTPVEDTSWGRVKNMFR